MLITGGAGMLGRALVPALAQAGHELVVTDIDLGVRRPWGEGGPTIGPLDVRHRHEVADAMAQVRPDFVVHLAAETSLERSDADPDHAYLTNSIATKYLALACRRARVPLAYISTAGVFDGTKDGPYTEFDAPAPLNVYGDSKLEGERFVRELLDDFYIVRAGWMVGGGPAKDHKFVARILGQVRDGRRVIHAVVDKLGTPTYTRDFAPCFLGLVQSEVYGLYHMACGGEGSRHDVARVLLDVLGRDDIELVGVTSDFFADEFPSVRPRSEIMRNLALDLQGMNTMRPWPVALDDYVHRHYADLIAPALAVATA
jgi:dTDP-4-dehydrorhamnose reductase